MLKKFKLCMCTSMVIALSAVNCSFASTAIIDTKVLNVRSSPVQTATKIGTVKLNEKYEILDTSDNWLKIGYNDDFGWICEDYVKIEDTSEPENQVNSNETQYKVVNTTTLNVRDSNSVSAGKIGTVKFGQKVEILETINEWDKIVFNNSTGWVCNTYLNVVEDKIVDIVDNEVINDNQETEDIVLKTAVINTTKLNVRASATTDSDKIGSLTKNAIVAIVGEEDGWYKIKYNNKYGYISSEYTLNKDITISRGSHTRGDKATTIAETATTLAMQYVGCKYVWGGTSPNGFDCSGLVYYVYKDYVPNLPRSATPQAKIGTTVEKENLVMGDLVFFGEDGGSIVTHVGIYVGDGIFVHAANSKRGVVTDSLMSGYYDKNFLFAKRIV